MASPSAWLQLARGSGTIRNHEDAAIGAWKCQPTRSLGDRLPARRGSAFGFHPATRRFSYNREVCPALTVAEQAELIRALAEDARVRFASNELYGCLRDPALAEILNTRFEPTRSPWLLIRRG